MMRLVLDACVIFPTVMRETLMGCANAGVFEPLWSDRIIEEWLRAADKLGSGARVHAAAEAAVMRDIFPAATVPQGTGEGLWLPDHNDVHVLETAILGAADGIVTVNTKDFPLRVLRDHGIARYNPDALLCAFSVETAIVKNIVLQVHRKAERVSGSPQKLRGILKRTGLPRLGKLVDQD